MLEKLGVEKQELICELQSEYSRKRMEQHELEKTGAPAPHRAKLAHELSEIRARLDQLQSET